MQSTCEHCGKTFAHQGKDRGKFCSKECRNDHGRQQKVCPTCGKTFTTFKSEPNARTYCSKECRPPKTEKITKICEGCNAAFEIWPSQSAQKYCSQQCRASVKSVIKPCEHCGKEFRSFVKAGRKHCSRECLTAAKRVYTTCPACGKEFWYNHSWPRIHCSLKCSTSVNAKKNLGIVELPEMFCEQCGKPITRNRYADKRFCSQSCFGDWQSENKVGENHPNYKGGGIEYYGPNWYSQRRKARHRDNYACQHCGITEQKIGREMDVHHMQPFRTFGYVPGKNQNHILANDLYNLISLCPSCHKLAEHGSIPIQPYLLAFP